MASVLIDFDGPTEEDMLEEWKKRFSSKRPFNIEKYYYNDTTMASFWEIMKKHNSGQIEHNDNKVRTHGTMGWSWMFSIPIQEEFSVLQSFFETVYLLDKEVCLAPALTRPYFVWFTDIDIKQSVPLEIDYVRKICQIVARTVSNFFPELKEIPYTAPKYYAPLEIKTARKTMKIKTQWNNVDGLWMGAGEGVARLRFLVASSGFKKGLNKNGEMEEGVGIHMYSIGRLLVTEEQAHVMLVAIASDCEFLLGPRKKEEGYNTWQDVFDHSVYKGQGGTRMLGSCKVKICTSCNDKSSVLSIREEDEMFASFEKSVAVVVDGQRNLKTALLKTNVSCSNCNGKKKYFEKKAYEAKFILNHEGNEDSSMEWLLDDPFQALLATNIRTRCKGPGKKNPNFTTYWKPIVGYSLPNEQETKEFSKKKKYTAPVDGTKEAKINQKYASDAFETEAVLSYAKEIDDMYLELLPEQLIRINKTKYILEIKNSRNWKYCLRCNKEHQNRIKFEVDTRYIYQTSHSDNQDCKQGRVVKKKISEDLIEILFGQTKKIEKQAPLLYEENEWPPERNNTLIPDETDSGKCYLKETRLQKEKEEYITAIYTWLMQKKQDRDPEGERKRHIEKETERRKGKIISKQDNDLPIWVARREPSKRDVYEEMVQPKKKQKPSYDPTICPQKDSDGFIWGTVIDYH